MRKMNLHIGRVSLLSFLGMASMSILTVEAQPLTTANGLWNTGVQADGTTLITGDPTGVANPIDPHYTVTY